MTGVIAFSALWQAAGRDHQQTSNRDLQTWLREEALRHLSS